MNLSQISQEFLAIAILVIISLIARIGNAIGTI
jgi:hypothetical protein